MNSKVWVLLLFWKIKLFLSILFEAGVFIYFFLARLDSTDYSTSNRRGEENPRLQKLPKPDSSTTEYKSNELNECRLLGECGEAPPILQLSQYGSYDTGFNTWSFSLGLESRYSLTESLFTDFFTSSAYKTLWAMRNCVLVYFGRRGFGKGRLGRRRLSL